MRVLTQGGTTLNVDDVPTRLSLVLSSEEGQRSCRGGAAE